jgi:hypothetical protein
MSGQKHRASFLTVPQQYALNVACRPLARIGYGTFHVGSSLTKQDYHDVDLRCMLPDDEYDRMFDSDSGEPFLLFLNAAISEWLSRRTGLPIDFQFQRASQANKTFTGQRNAVGH